MDAERWKQIEKVFQSALEQAPEARPTFLASACSGDQTLRLEVESLLAHQTIAGGALEAAIDDARQLFTEQQSPGIAGSRLGHYQILQQIGVGGMGEVYLAEDARLGRKVALKLLPALYTGDRDRVRRFAQEARAASALNHPNIITIFEIGQASIEEGGTHFIATEFVDGQTLRQRMGGKPLPLTESLDILIQTASALAAAHEAGIIHRDIKPENVMLRRDGYVKVLDFGLAKLTEHPKSAVETDVPTVGFVSTEPGLVMGTVAYMSPEQARGLEVDARTDIFSLGVMSYETLAGQRPFTGATNADVISAILHAEPPRLNTYLPEVPETLEWIVAKALHKNREERYQASNELITDLKRLKQQLELQVELARAGKPTAQNGVAMDEARKALVETKPVAVAGTGEMAQTNTSSSVEVLIGEIKRHKMGVAVALLTLLVAAGVGGFWLYRLLNQRQPFAPFQTMRFDKLTATGKALEAAISPDGKFVAYVLDEGDRQSLWLKQTGVASNAPITPSVAGRSYSSPAFARDGNYLYYLSREGRNARATLYQTPVLGPALGNEARKLVGDISTQDTRSNFSLSPDGKQVAFIRLDATFNRSLLVMNTDGSGERQLAARKYPEFISAAAWSPDEKTIVCIEGNFSSGLGNYRKLIAVRVADGVAQQVSTQQWSRVNSLVWLADGSGLALSAAEKPGALQLWYISYPDGAARRITNDLNNYGGVSLTADSSALVTVVSEHAARLWVAPNGEPSRARQITAEAGDYDFLAWTPDGRIVYSAPAGGNTDIRVINADGTGNRQLTANADINLVPSVSPDGSIFYSRANRDGNSLWRMDGDGGNPRQLLGSPVSFPQCSPDGNWVIFYRPIGNQSKLWKVSTSGGEPVQLTDKGVAARPAISPDGEWIACNYIVPGPNSQFGIAIFPFAGGEPVKVFDVPGSAIRELHWTPDSRAITYLDTRNGVSNLWAQPIAGGTPKPLTNFQSDQISSWAWSRDGKQLAFVRGPRTSDVVLISSFR